MRTLLRLMRPLPRSKRHTTNTVSFLITRGGSRRRIDNFATEQAHGRRRADGHGVRRFQYH